MAMFSGWGFRPTNRPEDFVKNNNNKKKTELQTSNKSNHQKHLPGSDEHAVKAP